MGTVPLAFLFAFLNYLYRALRTWRARRPSAPTGAPTSARRGFPGKGRRHLFVFTSASAQISDLYTILLIISFAFRLYLPIKNHVLTNMDYTMLFIANTMCTSRIFAQNNHFIRMRDTNETQSFTASKANRAAPIAPHKSGSPAIHIGVSSFF